MQQSYNIVTNCQQICYKIIGVLILINTMAARGLVCEKRRTLAWSCAPCLSNSYSVGVQDTLLFFEIAVVETLEALAVACFVFCHFVNGVMDCVEVELFGTTGDADLVCVCACFGCHALFEVFFG